ncbi:MAG TPA: hypothetical protein PKA33_07195 [Amaricoccus sp.]|uniref:hypothetical protein n=1 Tax=Amaricoccus sp. TaxID=1872485 RepID=UPI002BA48D77|nr:hypothetical protein [Amaricoccus sp.]HMQ93377.1 hypothetical protein [Amaricoccus sp.]HMR51806.1 hypothetical protein [Amaricoccus sp.]HMR59358.1 hypothetical protein [Amaricoccus sp.]HMT99140.1 hypothetical protein [Amaricoccus sp.]
MSRLLGDLLDDARLVASFGQRAGVLRESGLFEALHRADAAPQLDWSSEEVIDLQREMNSAVVAIRPVTLVDLKNGFDPFRRAAKDGQGGRNWLRITLMVLAALLTLTCGYFTIWQKRASDVLMELAAGKAESQRAIVEELLPLVDQFKATGSPPDLDDAGSLTRAAFRQKMEDAQRIALDIVVDTRRYNQTLESFNPFNRVIDPIKRIVSPPPPEGTRQAPPIQQDNGETAAQLVASKEEAPVLPVEAMPSLPKWLEAYGHCLGISASGPTANIVNTAEVPDPRGTFHFGELVATDVELIQQVRCLVGLQDIESRNSQNRITDPQDMRDWVDTLSNWILPSLYGMLGAVIYHLRVCLNPLRPDPKPVQAAMRVFLGGFAGVAIAWFWGPSVINGLAISEVSPSELTDVSLTAHNQVSLTALTVAFLVGFGIDVFFSLLDRLVTVFNSMIDNIGTTST